MYLFGSCLALSIIQELSKAVLKNRVVQRDDISALGFRLLPPKHIHGKPNCTDLVLFKVINPLHCAPSPQCFSSEESLR